MYNQLTYVQTNQLTYVQTTQLTYVQTNQLTYVQTTQPVTLTLSISTTGCVCSEEIGVTRVSRNDEPNYLNRLWTLHTSPCVPTKNNSTRKNSTVASSVGQSAVGMGKLYTIHRIWLP